MVVEYVDPVDGLPLLPIKRHTEEKLTYLRKYLPALNTILRKKVPGRPRYYIDFFSGPGRCIDTHNGKVLDGSPLISVKTRPEFTNFIFVDANPEYCKALRVRTASIPNVVVKEGDCNRVAFEILSEIDGNDPCFAFLDPFGLELEWATVEELSKKPRIDILINFPVGSINRNMSRRGSEPAVTKCMGCEDWKNITEKKAVARKRLRDLYMTKMRERFRCVSPVLVFNRVNVPLYYLIYGCHFDVGKKIWEYITKPPKNSMLNGSGWVYSE